MKAYRGLLAALAVVVALVVAPSAQAAFPSVYEGEVTCTAQPLNGNIRACSGKVPTWDHTTKIDVNVFLPPETGGTEGPYPLIGDFHGWGGSKQGLTTVEPEPVKAPGLTFQQKDPRIQHWAESGYAVFSMTDRGWGESCGKLDPEAGGPACEKGYNHLMDDRYEVRDAQYLMSVLADEGIAEPDKVGATGASYGGGISVALGALRNREMMPNGELVPWESPDGEPMEIAATVPQWAWTDIAYALAPNGRNLDYVTESSYRGPSGKAPIGVMKYSYTEALYQTGLAIGKYSKTDPEANIPGWRERLLAGEPYSDPGVNAMIEQLTTYHSSFYIDHSEAPSPTLLQSGWNDDLFPADEALRFYQRTRAQYPSDPISLFFADYGHSRSQNKPADVALFQDRLEAWFAHYLKGEGPTPSSSVEALTTTCPSSAASEGPFKAAGWAGLQPGEISAWTEEEQTIGHDTPAEEQVPTESGGAFDPIVGAKTPCVEVPERDEEEEEEENFAEYRLEPAPGGGFTLMGSPTIIADVESPSPNSEIAARLLDASPGGTERLVARGLYRPVGGSQEIVFQLHPQAYHFAAGHEAVLELLPNDMPYGRFSNLQANVTVNDLELRLPVMDQPGSLGGLVETPQAKVVPAGYTLAAEFETKSSGGGSGGGGTTPLVTPPPPKKIGTGTLAGKLTTTRSQFGVPLQCGGEGACSGKFSFSVKQKGSKKRTTLVNGSYSIDAGKTVTVRVPLTKAGKNLIKNLLAGPNPPKTLSGQFVLNDSSSPKSQTSNRAVQLPRGK
ncbi:MAG TPA: CocE/NonD family hydrolase [Solirubrobacterales bacterium]|nr:CocE/NonD family hydrolase [Solirubrobacterales bacterium]